MRSRKSIQPFWVRRTRKAGTRREKAMILKRLFLTWRLESTLWSVWVYRIA